MYSLSLQWIPGDLAVCRLDPTAPFTLPPSATGLVAVVRTVDELSVLCGWESAPAGAKVEGPWRAFRVVGTLDFSLTGILAKIAVPLADAAVSIFAVSTFDTDYVLVRADVAAKAEVTLTRAGHRWVEAKA